MLDVARSLVDSNKRVWTNVSLIDEALTLDSRLHVQLLAVDLNLPNCIVINFCGGFSALCYPSNQLDWWLVRRDVLHGDSVP